MIPACPDRERPKRFVAENILRKDIFTALHSTVDLMSLHPNQALPCTCLNQSNSTANI
jgi:hypothetical protein